MRGPRWPTSRLLDLRNLSFYSPTRIRETAMADYSVKSVQTKAYQDQRCVVRRSPARPSAPTGLAAPTAAAAESVIACRRSLSLLASRTALLPSYRHCHATSPTPSPIRAPPLTSCTPPRRPGTSGLRKR